jgi:hypothetical protein
MAEQALHKIRLIRKNYIGYSLLSIILLSVAIGTGAGIILSVLFSITAWCIVVFILLTAGILLAIRRPWQIEYKAIAGFLNATYPELEESCNLVLKPVAEMNLLERLQLLKVERVLQQVPGRHKHFTNRLKVSTTLFVIAIILIAFGRNLHVQWDKSHLDSVLTNEIAKSSVPEKTLPQISALNITIKPPAYTRQSKREQDKFTLVVEDGAMVSWDIKTNVAASKISLLFNEQELLPVKSDNDDKTSWVAQKTIVKPGFYQVIIDGKRSDLYQVQVIKDSPPVIQIKSPKQYTYIDAGEKPQIDLSATLTDDYGIAGAVIFATVAKGSGEAVKFKEQKLSFLTSFNGQEKYYDLEKMINLPALNMEPGDELYFYIQATDNHSQQSRTDVYTVSIQDTAQLLSMDGILGAANVKPEYFRSERQIILDSERLLKEKDTISQQSFNERSNELGMDQKLLRLRYGKFLGEEAEDNIADPKLQGKNDLSAPEDFSNASKILDAYTDKHDNAEDAQFFDPTVKAQLKATLTEMWKAELQLRLYKPQDALPFEYKALRLLKDLQQKSRAYVAKTAFNPTPLKMEKRLTGDLSKIIDPANHQTIKAANDSYDALKKSITILEQLKNIKALSGSDYRTLQAANQQLSEKASQQPGVYLAAVSSMRHILNGDNKNTVTNIALIESAIQKILPANQPLPQHKDGAADMGLSQGYYLKLNHLNR